MTIREFLDEYFVRLSNLTTREGEPKTVYVHLSETAAGAEITHFMTRGGDTYWDGAKVEPVVFLSPQWTGDDEASARRRDLEQYIVDDIEKRYPRD